MPPSATLCAVPLSTTFNSTLERSLLSIDWVLTSGLSAVESLVSGRLCFPVSASLPFDLVLGRDWLVHCTNSVPDACFYLSSGLVNLASFAPDPPALCSSTHSPTMDIDGPEHMFFVPQIYFCSDIYAQPGEWVRRLPPPGTPCPLELHSIPSHNMSLIECHRALLHQILSGACADYENDADHIAHIRLARQRQQQVQQGTNISAATISTSDTLDQIYHIYIERLKVLDKGYGDAWTPAIPRLPVTTPMTPKKRGRDDAADNVFDAFNSVSPVKRGRKAN
ncbi:hypothetical protein B0H10DRAFT_2100872 [Mycena sp. CBHHK59/15]|nr:hypothetical protein B0H10DRAFT_2100872 [Mycena sp. CBHHK59/15]